MKYCLSIGMVALLSLCGVAQKGLSGGLSYIKGFGVPKGHPGIHIGIEIPRDDEVSYYGRLTTTLATRSEPGTLEADIKDQNNSDAIAATGYSQSVKYQASMNYTNLEGGTRYYLGNGYDYGWSAYGGSLFMLSLNSVKARLGDYDKSNYALPSDYSTTHGRILALSLGLNAGIKNHFAFGMLYFDITFAYAIIYVPNNQVALDGLQALYSPLNFGFNFGFRKDLF